VTSAVEPVARRAALGRGVGRLNGGLLARVERGANRRRRRRGGGVAVWVAAAWLVGLLILVLVADLLPLRSYDVIVKGAKPRGAPHLGFDEPLGIDALGRSVLSRIIYGARQSLIVGVLTIAIAMSVGLLLGGLGGYFRGKLDNALGVLFDAVLSLPALVVLLAIAAVGKRDTPSIVLGLALVTMPTFARLARANTLALASREHVAAARVLGASHLRILFRELLPEVGLRVSSFSFLLLAVVLVTEGSLSFLGLGIPPPSPSWGGMINAGRPLLEQAPQLVFVPAAFLLITVVALTVVGDRVRRRFDRRESMLP
jgi:peptide/nickel transport system permease protein